MSTVREIDNLTNFALRKTSPAMGLELMTFRSGVKRSTDCATGAVVLYVDVDFTELEAHN